MEFDFITDRTAKDVLEAQTILSKVQSGQKLTDAENEKLLNGLRGCYNISDINRVISAIKDISNLLKIDIAELQSVEIQDFFSDSDWQKYLNAIRLLRQYIALPSSTPQAPISLFVSNAHERANDIEKILVQLERYIPLMIDAYYYSGEIYAGEV